MSDCVVVYLSSFLPRKCGIATFTQDVSGSVNELLAPALQYRIVAMNADATVPWTYPEQVIFQIFQEDMEQYREVARQINKMDEVKLINIQHEFGLHGGEYGTNLLAFLEIISKPVVITFHTVLPNPNPQLRDAVKMLAANVRCFTAPTYYARKILFEDYGIPEEMVTIIPHGIPLSIYSPPGSGKEELGFSGKIILTTFGLLSRGKGLEFVIEALPEVVSRYPEVIYNIVGATHPNIVKQEGESYRESLMQRVTELRLEDHVHFYNQFFTLEQLLKYLEATDIYICTSLDPNQAVSGTLSYALGMGRPVISTPFEQAREDVTSDVGVLADFGSSRSYTDGIIRILEDEQWRLNLGRNAYFKSRRMTWPNVAIRYLHCFCKYSPEIADIRWQKNPPSLKMDHLARLTDDFGIFQFALLSEPDRSWGYTLDDNARALIAACLYYQKLTGEEENASTLVRKKELAGLMEIYLNFIEYVAKDDGWFNNYVGPDRTLNHKLNGDENLDDANSRAFFALCFAGVNGSIPPEICRKAFRLCKHVLQSGVKVSSPRAIAFHIKGLCNLLEHNKRIPGVSLKTMLTDYSDKLVSLFRSSSSSDWQWFEDRLTYSNAVLPDSLLCAYQVTGEDGYLRLGKQCLDFLIKNSFINGVYAPVGQEGWHHRYGLRSHFDQQPVDVTAMVQALKTYYGITSDESYRKLMRQVFNWFLGDNTNGQMVYNHATGGCYDGLGETQVNLNEGAESTVSYLIARLTAFD